MSFTFKTIPLYSIFVCKERQCEHLKYVADGKFECTNPNIESSYKCEQLTIWTQCDNCERAQVCGTVEISSYDEAVFNKPKPRLYKCTGNPEIKDIVLEEKIGLRPSFLTMVCKYRSERMSW